jgi:hypothetical protein
LNSTCIEPSRQSAHRMRMEAWVEGKSFSLTLASRLMEGKRFSLTLASRLMEGEKIFVDFGRRLMEVAQLKFNVRGQRSLVHGCIQDLEKPLHSEPGRLNASQFGSGRADS